MRNVFVVIAILFCTTAAFGQVDAGVLKSGPDQADLDTDVTYTITVTSNGPDDAAGILLTDDIPPDMTFVSASPSAGCTTPAVGTNGTVTCTIASLPAGDSVVYTFVFHLSPNAEGTEFQNTATVALQGDVNDENDSSSVFTTLPPPPQSDGSILKNGPLSAGPNTDVTYSISVANGGPDTASTLSWSDTLPGTMTFVSLNQDSGPTMSCSTPAVGAGGPVSCSLSNAPSGTTATFTLVGHIPSNTSSGTAFQNSATVTAVNDPNDENNASTTELTVSAVDLSIVKSGPLTANATVPYSYTIVIANNGPNVAVGVTWTDTLPPNTTFVSLTQDNGPTATNCTTPPPGTNDVVSCFFNNLGNGESAKFTLTVAAGNTPTVTNTTVAGSESFDTDTNNNTSSATTTITPSADLSIVKSGPPAVTSGTDASYSVTVRNNGPTDATNVTVTDVLPAQTTFVSAVQNSGPAGSCSFSAGTITCTMASFPLNAVATFTFVLHVSPAAPNGSTISNTASVSASTGDPNGGNNSSNTSATVAPTADLVVTKSGPATIVNGSNATYDVTVTNNGPSNAANATLTDTLPPNTTFVSANQTSGPPFNCVNNATTITCTIASLPAGSSASFQFVVNIGADARGSITNSVTATSSTVDPTPGNSTATATTVTSRPGDAPMLSPLALALLGAALGLAGLFAVRRG